MLKFLWNIQTIMGIKSYMQQYKQLRQVLSKFIISRNLILFQADLMHKKFTRE